MKRLLGRVLRRSSPGGRGPHPLVSPTTPASDTPASNRSLEASGRAESLATVIQALRHCVAEASLGRLRAEEVHEHGQLFDRGYLDSFSYVEFLAFIEQTYRVRIDDSQLAGHLTTIAAMAEHILREQARSPD
jgi:acyl carrier protein